ncbi:uncharacterized protein JCM15063_002001 [Sporobolomyces koalae]|uniref:uncharacterized protein n=1 Tax=Sporobolomyces koalae TaxID=500713 RepID=UPI003173F735
MANPHPDDGGSDPEQYHYLSSIPLAPASTSRNLTRANPYAVQTHSQNDFSSASTSPSGDGTPLVPSPYENPSSALFPFTPGPLEVTDNGATSPVEPRSMSSPPRPRRPSQPDLAVIFGNPNPPPLGPLPDLPEEDQTSHSSARSPTFSHRKPVPSFIPTPPRSDPLAVDFPTSREVSSPSSSGPGRLSVGTFEGLLQQGETPASAIVAGYRDEGLFAPAAANNKRLSSLRGEDDQGNVVWSPRLNLGLDERGFEAREDRIRQDQLKLQREMQGQDLGEPSQLLEVDENRHEPHTPSPRKKSNRAVADKVFSPVGRRDIPFLSPRYYRGTANEEDDPEEVDQSGPVLRRGSKRLSDLADPSAAPSTSEPHDAVAGHESRRKSKASTLHKMAPKRTAVPREWERSKKRPKEGTEVEVVVHDSASQDEGDFSDKSVTPVVPAYDEGDWERTRKEATCLSARMNWTFVEFDSWFARFVHLFYPFAMFAHIPATVFLDFNLLYLLCQVALYPALPAANSVLAIFSRRAIIPVPDVAESTGWWVAVGVYAACTAVWLFGVCLWKECGRGYLRRWGGGGGKVQIEKVYTDSASFNYACVRSFGTFSFMWQVRLAPLRPKSPLAKAVEGTSRLDFVRETLCWYRQNWPTVLLLIPRAAISVAVLLLYTTTAYGTSTATNQFVARDSAYFAPATGALTGFAAGVVLTNCVWAALRLVVLVVAWIGLWMIDRPFSCVRRAKRDEALSSRYQVDTASSFGFDEKPFQLGATVPRLPYGSTPPTDWRVRRQRRIRAAILVCLGSTPLSSTSSTVPSPYLRSPYVLGAGSPWSQSTGKGKTGQTWVEKAEHNEYDDRRRAYLAGRGDDRNGSDVMLSSPPRRQGFWSKLSPFVSPSAKFDRSPIISFSRASPPIGHASAMQPRRASMAQLDSTDIADSRLHRRVRSVPLEDSDYIHFEEVPLSSREQPAQAPSDHQRRFSTTPSLPSPPAIPTPGPSNQQYPFPSNLAQHTRSSDLRLSIPDRPGLVSRFSAFSSAGPSTFAMTPAATTPVPQLPTRNMPSSSGLLEAQLAHIPTEHLKLSDKLLSELRRVESYDRKFPSGRSRGSEIDTSSWATAPTGVASSTYDPSSSNVDRSLRYSQASYVSQPDSVGGQSENSTLRGAVRTPDLSRSLATFANSASSAAINEAEGEEDASDPVSTDSTRSPQRPLLPPFRLSSDSRADNLSLGPATPILGAATTESGEFSGSPPALGKESRP